MRVGADFTPVRGGWASLIDTRYRAMIAEVCDQLRMYLYFVVIDLDEEAGLRESPVLQAILPEASEDVLTAIEVASVARAGLATSKMRRLEMVIQEVKHPSGPRGSVLVRAGQEDLWLAALNDVRLTEAAHMGITSPEAAEIVHRVARLRMSPKKASVRGITDPEMAPFYELVTWWQESLLSVVLAGEGPA